MDRRKFIINSGMAVGAGVLLKPLKAQSPALRLDSWSDIRLNFNLANDRINMALMLLASHPKPVADAIKYYREALDHDPVTFWENNRRTLEEDVKNAAAKYINAQADEIALTDSTTMGLSILYTGLKLTKKDEILTTTHDHYSTEKSITYASEKTGASIRRITLYKEANAVTVDEVTDNLKKAINAETRIVAVTWVHSSTGVKLPIKAMAEVIKEANTKRTLKDRIYFCVDGVHGFGIENINMAELGCDFFAAGTHKWLFGPRGTGILYAKKDAWHMIGPTIPAFSRNAYGEWLGLVPKEELTFSDVVTPGGFHSFENRWALSEAFNFHLSIGKEKVEERTHYLSSLLKNALASIKHVKLHTPVSDTLSAGINCFEVQGLTESQIVERLHKKHIIASTSPYKISYARLTPCIIHSEEEVLTCVRELENIKSS